MVQEPIQSASVDVGASAEALSNEVLKLKVDDLFQELENLKGRVSRLESQVGCGQKDGREQVKAAAAPGVVSDPDGV